jgi:hypothetical protein
MPVDADAALALVQRIYTRLNARRPDVDKREQYYRGEQPLSFATAEWKKANADRYTGFSDNWSGPVVDAEAERICYTGILVPGFEGAGKALHEDWLRNELDMQSSQGFVTTLTTARSFVIVWGDGDNNPIVTWEHPSYVEIEYAWYNPRVRVAALKTWTDEADEYATLYEPDAVWKFSRPRIRAVNDNESQATQSKTPYAANGGWQAYRGPRDGSWPLNNPLGEVPVVEVPNRPTLMGDPISEIQGVIPMQDAINLLWAYLLLSADYASMDARVVLGASPPLIPILDNDGKQIGTRPAEMKDLREKRLMFITGENSKIDAWKAAALDVFTDTIDVAVGHIASQTRTPPTYLVTKTGMSNVNGEGLKASEIGLNKKVLEFQTFASAAMREVNRLIALVRNEDGLADAIRLAKVTWMNPEIRSEAQLADMLVKKKSIGYPFRYLLELDGVAPGDMDRIVKLRDEELAALLGAGVRAAVEDALNGDDTV